MGNLEAPPQFTAAAYWEAANRTACNCTWLAWLSVISLIAFAIMQVVVLHSSFPVPKLVGATKLETTPFSASNRLFSSQLSTQVASAPNCAANYSGSPMSCCSGTFAFIFSQADIRFAPPDWLLTSPPMRWRGTIHAESKQFQFTLANFKARFTTLAMIVPLKPCLIPPFLRFSMHVFRHV